MKYTTEPRASENVPAAARTSSHSALVRGRSPLPPALSSSPDAFALLKALRRRWQLAVLMGSLSASAAVLAAWHLVPPAKYTARALMHVASIPPMFVFTTADNAVRDRSEFETFKRTQAALVKSRSVLNAALREPGVVALEVVRKQLDPVEWLEDQIQVDSAEGSEIMQIGISGKEPRDTATLVNAIADSYIKVIVGKQRADRATKLNVLKEIHDDFQEKLRDNRTSLKRFAEEAGSDDKHILALKNKFALERLDAAQKELYLLRSELRRAATEGAVRPEVVAAPEVEVPEALIDEQIRNDPGTVKYRERIDQSQRLVQNAKRLTRNPNDPALRRYEQELRSAQATLAEYTGQLRPAIVARLRERYRRGPESLPSATGQTVEVLKEVERALSVPGFTSHYLGKKVEVLKEVEKLLATDVERLTRETRTANQTTLDMQSLREDFAPADNAAKRVGEELEAMRVELRSPPRVSLIERAEVPRQKDELRQVKMAGAAGVGTLFAVILGIAFWEFSARRVSTGDEIANGLGLSLMGSLPALPYRARGRRGVSTAAREHYGQNLLIDSVDATRTVLLHGSPVESLRVVMVTSASTGEGKTTLSSYLAISLARTGRKTLLIDCDLREPAVHDLFGLPSGPGVSELLRGEADLNETIHAMPTDGLWLIPAGQCDPRAIQSLAQEGVRELFDELKRRFDIIIVDASPILSVADALLIGQQSDGVVMSVLSGVSRIPKVYAACERISALGIRMLGAVVTGAPDHLFDDESRYRARGAVRA